MNTATQKYIALTAVLLLAFGLRVFGLNSVPPGWRDDEVIETTVHAQRVLDGERPLFFIEAEGHEPLYHYVSAAWIALFGNSLVSVRLVSSLFGLLAVAATYPVAARLTDRRTGLLATVLVAIAFWALMYGRVKTRHISTLAFALLTLALVWRASQTAGRRGWLAAVGAGVLVGLALYTYFAALTVPVIIVLFGAFLLWARRGDWRTLLRASVVPLLIGLGVYAPLFVAMRTAGSTAGGAAERLAVVGAPLVTLLQGNPLPVLQNTAITLLMFIATGDPEALYNLPGRPVFGPGLFLVFAIGLVTTTVLAVRNRDERAGLLLAWFVGGLSPDFVSVPAASLGHAIVAMPAAYLLLAVGTRWLMKPRPPARTPAYLHWLLPLLVVAAFAARDGYDYFVRWPRNDVVRLLYHADLHTALRERPPSGQVLLASDLSMWEIRAFLLDAQGLDIDAQWSNPEWAWVFGNNQPTPLWHPVPDARPVLTGLEFYAPPGTSLAPTPFNNGLTLLGFSFSEGHPRDFMTHWHVSTDFEPPDPDIGSDPQPPEQPWRVFVHLYDEAGERVFGIDRFDADVFTLTPGDTYVQYHPLRGETVPEGVYTIVVGMYDVRTGNRFVTADGRDVIELGSVTINWWDE